MANQRQKEANRKKKREAKQRAARGATQSRTHANPAATAAAAFIREAAAPYRQAIAGGASPVDVLATAASDMDEAVAAAWMAARVSPACHKGCSHCCKGMRVEVSVPEAVAIADYIRSALPADTGKAIATRVADNAPKTHGTSMLHYPYQLPCALLGPDGECLVYEVRPLTCRQEHSRDALQCEAGFNAPPGTDSPIEHDLQVSAVAARHKLAFDAAIRGGNRIDKPLELQEALLIALRNEDALDDWLSGGSKFASAIATQGHEDGLILPHTLVR